MHNKVFQPVFRYSLIHYGYIWLWILCRTISRAREKCTQETLALYYPGIHANVTCLRHVFREEMIVTC